MIDVGEGFGKSMPLNNRIRFIGATGYETKLDWGDGVQTLGHYIGVLATEYKLLNLNSHDTYNTLRELYWALYAFNRLDENAETYYYDPNDPNMQYGSPNLNGFFVRDDVGAILNYNNFNTNPLIDGPNSNYYKATWFDSDYSTASNNDCNEMSKDQVIQLLVGLGLVTKCVPANTTFFDNDVGYTRVFQDLESDINTEAKNIIKRVIEYMHHQNNVNNGWDWKIYNPVKQQLVKRGSRAIWLSWGYASTELALTGFQTDGMSSPLALTAKAGFLALESSMLNGLTLADGEGDKVLLLAALSNAWIISPSNSILIQSFQNPIYKYDYIPLLYHIINGGINVALDNLESYYNLLLNIAPCNGPYNFTTGIYPNYEWSSNSRTLHPWRRGDLNTNWPGYSNGLDYMLLYNLYCLYFNKQQYYYNYGIGARYYDMANQDIYNYEIKKNKRRKS